MLYTTKNFKDTQELGEKIALRLRSGQAKENRKSAVVLALRGNLGGGKTTFLQGFAKGLGIKENITSPTFVIQKKFEIRNSKFETFYHLDCYRLNKPEEILELDYKNIIKNPKNIVAIEWPEKIEKLLPKDTIEITFKFIDENNREINLKI
ncbi:MAG: tRNA (adenosine(37)-N6)-threonylcarbamoyltransferase complex ATPase subunit type 1 TsaE [Candidatus Staskawiczbacteria bacterium]|nr:tRNA (adenosine(37)-N6)-threonylcarbamoyltransferase complex ATPase subunit type 1 TsaE [Candidatus Staskawiczbacteria bacterium]